MLKNENGSTLLVVLVMMLVFTVLGLSILSTSIGGAKRTESREEQVTNDLDSIRTLGEAVAFIKEMISSEYNSKNPDMSISQYDNLISDSILGNSFGYQIENITGEYSSINENEDFTRVLQVTSGKYKQIVYITGIPSFLKYAVGSRGILTFNGSTFVEKGNIYANEKLVISNQAKYIYNGESLVENTTYPSVYSENENLLFIENEQIDYCSNNCYRVNEKNEHEKVENHFDSLPINELSRAFQPTAPTFMREENEYVAVDIEKTFKEKLKLAGFLASHVDPYVLEIDEIISQGMASPSVEIVNSFDNIGQSPSINGYLYPTHGEQEVYIDTNSLIMDDKSKWIIVDGNAVIENIGNQLMEVSANILITGDLTIRGDIAFDSTIYVLGDTTINNVNITGYNEGELILLTQGQLEIARINKFRDSNEVNSIKAYLYTNEDAEVYAMGSYLHVEGGIFSKGNLEINAYRGAATDKETHIEFNKGSDNDATASRLIIKNNKKLFLNQSQGLPKIDRLEVVTDLMKKSR
ncbi:hypothetical protein [Robertmurraya kyonggiensis]|uniref:Uncharacterized protein n=1 Tax=Robertmurraya kyonggiensis TaxID=1037680 RepID=A0A4U1D0E5_9BACI|nr:hypothetical protein [Robertmurraya kyonggiensis]TKC15631.1 hypothetical protein FA727_16005 [Robertmurraya kyonggiensis]